MTDRDRHPDSPPARHELAEVFLALSIDQDQPAGPCPSPEDIAAWHERRLPASEANRIQAHVARCNSCFDIWTGLLEDSDPVPAASTSRARRDAPGGRLARWWNDRTWISYGGGLTAVAASLLVVALLVPAIRHPPLERRVDDAYQTFQAHGRDGLSSRWPWDGGLPTRSLEAGDTGGGPAGERRRRAFQAGVRAGLAQAAGPTPFWQSVIERLPAEPPPCTHGTRADPDCDTVNKLHGVAGRWAVLMYLACVDGGGEGDPVGSGLPPSFWARQADTLTALRDNFADRDPGAPLGTFFSNWIRVLDHDPTPQATLCGRSRALLSMGLQ